MAKRAKEKAEMSSFVVLVGTIDSEPTARQVGEAKKLVADVRLATNPGWYTVVCWEKLGDQVKNLAVGTPLLVTGRLNGRSYENKDGVKVNVVEVVASTIEVLSSSVAVGDGGDLFGD